LKAENGNLSILDRRRSAVNARWFDRCRAGGYYFGLRRNFSDWRMRQGGMT
jgi:hypothetical protein